MDDIFDELISSVNAPSLYKICRTCKESKFVSYFSLDKTKKDGRTTQCKSCYSEYHNKNSLKINERRKSLHDRYRERSKLKSKEWARNNPEKVKNKSLSKYGLTLIEFNSLVEVQNGLCLICKCELVIGRHTHVDHCHTTGKVRGILCQSCNTKLGWFEKNHHEILSYLNRSK